MRQRDCEAVLLACLLHDLGQYLFAHAFEESEIANRRVYSHSDLTRRLLAAKTPEELECDADTLFGSSEDRARVAQLLRDDEGRLLSDIIRDAWCADLDDVLYLLGDDTRPPRPALKLLRRIVDGPLDADKIDYLRRNALHLGISGSPDLLEVLASLTVVPLNATKDEYDLALEPSGVSAAQDVHMARYRMFVGVYWEPVVRSAERMLRFAVDGLRDYHGETAFRQMFFARILTCSDAQLVADLRQHSEHAANECTSNKQPALLGIAKLLGDIERRQLYKETYVLDANVNGALHEQLSCFWAHALRDFDANNTFKEFTRRFVDLLERRASRRLPQHQVLLDIPDPTTDQPKKYALLLRKTDGGPEPIDNASPMWKEFSELFRLHGRKIRIFAERDVATQLSGLDFETLFREALGGVRPEYFHRPRSTPVFADSWDLR